MVLMASNVKWKNVTLNEVKNGGKGGNILPSYPRGHQHQRMSRRAIKSKVATIGAMTVILTMGDQRRGGAGGANMKTRPWWRSRAGLRTEETTCL